jgi:phytoene desaturase
VPVPHLGADIDWGEAGRGVRDRVVSLLEGRLLPGLSRHIVTEHAIDPRYFRDELNSPLGSAFSIEPRLDQSAWFRPHNASDDVRGLYFVGAGTHPGAGIPGVLSSGKIAAELIGPSRAAPRRASPASRPHATVP